MATALTVETTRDSDGTLVLTASGEIDLSNVDTFRRGLAEVVGEPTTTGRATVDLRAVEYLDSSAVNALFTHADQVRLVVNRLLLPVLTVSGLADVVPIDQT